MKKHLVPIVIILLFTTTASSQEGATTEDVSSAILEYSSGAECGYYCGPDRREGVEDRSDYVVTPEDAEAMASAMLDSDVPLHTLLGTAAHETSFQRYAVGASGECGVFQQNPRFVHEDLALKSGCEARAECDAESLSRICDALQVPSIAVDIFEWQYGRLTSRFGEAHWECAYNQGASTVTRQGSYWVCTYDGREYREENHRFESWLFSLVEEAIESRRVSKG